MTAGRIRWQRTVHEEIPHEGGHYSGSLASNSPVTDGEHLFAFFGSHGLYCLDFRGDLLWKRTLGEMQTKHGHGEGSSPVLCRDVVIVNWDHEGQSFVIAFDKRTGEQRWKTERDELTSWATPIAIESGGRTQVVVSGTNRIRGYDVATGKVIWQCGGLSANVVASPVAAHGTVFADSSYDTRTLLAVSLDGAQGDITGTDHVVWSRTRGTPYVPSLLLYGDSLYFLGHYQGILSRVNAKTGPVRFGLAASATCMRRRWRPPIACMSQTWTAQRWSSVILPAQKSWHETDSTTASLPQPPSSEVSCTCAVGDTSIVLRQSEVSHEVHRLPSRRNASSRRLARCSRNHSDSAYARHASSGVSKYNGGISSSSSPTRKRRARCSGRNRTPMLRRCCRR